MASEASNDSGEQDWRLEAELDTSDARRSLDELLGHVRGGDGLLDEIETGAPHEVVITHDGKLLFAYAATEGALSAARETIEKALSREGIAASVRLSHWDARRDRWLQTDPPLTGAEAQAEQVADRDEETVETRTMVVLAGRAIRAEFEQTMLTWAAELGLECKIVEHPHLLTTQVGFTVTGPKRKLDEFAQGLRAEGWATIRTETGVMLSPL